MLELYNMLPKGWLGLKILFLFDLLVDENSGDGSDDEIVCWWVSVSQVFHNLFSLPYHSSNGLNTLRRGQVSEKLQSYVGRGRRPHHLLFSFSTAAFFLRDARCHNGKVRACHSYENEWLRVILWPVPSEQSFQICTSLLSPLSPSILRAVITFLPY